MRDALLRVIGESRPVDSQSFATRWHRTGAPATRERGALTHLRFEGSAREAVSENDKARNAQEGEAFRALPVGSSA